MNGMTVMAFFTLNGIKPKNKQKWNQEKQIKAYEKKWKVSATRIFYLAVPPNAFEEIAVKLGSSGLAENRLLSRIVIEKPFGYDIESAKHLNDLLHTIFDESQIYRIDH